MIIKKIIDSIIKGNEQDRYATLYRNLIRHEAKIGAHLFGPIPEGHRREFFCLDEHTWVWHEEWFENGQSKSLTTRYDVRPNGIYKVQHGQYRPVSKIEAKRLIQAATLYRERVYREIYSSVV